MIKERLDINVAIESTNNAGQFDVMADSEPIASRGGNALTRVLFGAGFPDPADVVDELTRRLG